MKTVSTDSILRDGKCRCCRTHSLGHTKVVRDEPCHIHPDTIHRMPHNFYCMVTLCRHYWAMRRAEKLSRRLDRILKDIPCEPWL